MSAIVIKDFRGELPGINVGKLKAGFADTASNIRMDAKTLGPEKGTTQVQATTTVGTALAIYKYPFVANKWFEWTGFRHAFKYPVANDPYDRVIIAGDATGLIFADQTTYAGTPPLPAATYLLGVPQPNTACVAAVSGTPTDASDLADTRYYVTTYVDSYGAEGAPSAVSNEVEAKPGEQVDLTSIPGAPAGNYNLSHKRIYRTSTGSSSTEFQLVADNIPLAQVTYTDTTLPENLGEIIPSETYMIPSADMTIARDHPNGFIVGAYGNVFCASEAGYPHAWPVAYERVTQFDILDVQVVGGITFILTEGNPYAVAGSHPAAFAMKKLDIEQSLQSLPGVVNFGSHVVYPSPDGLVALTPKTANIVTSDVFTRDEWQSMDPTSMKAYAWERKYLCFYDDGVNQKGFVIDPLQPEKGVIFFDLYATAGFNDVSEDKLYLVISDNIVEWATGANLTYNWKSGTLRTEKPTNFAWGQVLADAYPITYKYYADGVLKHTETAANANPFRLPGGFEAEDFVLEVTGTGEIRHIAAAQTITDLKQID